MSDVATSEKLKNLLGTLEKSVTGGCFLALSGKPSNSLRLNVFDKVFENSWILDLRGTDHMTHVSNHFSTYTACPSNRKIIVPDRTTTTVAGAINGAIAAALPTVTPDAGGIGGAL